MHALPIFQPWREVFSQVLFFAGLMALLFVAISGASDEGLSQLKIENLPHRRNEQPPDLRHSVSNSAATRAWSM